MVPGRHKSVGIYHTHNFECLCFSGKFPFSCSVDRFLPDRLDLRPFRRWAPQKGKWPKFCPLTTKLSGIIWVAQKSILTDQHKGSHKEIWINCKFCVLPKIKKMACKFNGTQTNWPYQPKMPVLIQCHFETQTAQYIEPRNTPEINENQI